jgi:hypothetical protein
MQVAAVPYRFFWFGWRMFGVWRRIIQYYIRLKYGRWSSTNGLIIIIIEYTVFRANRSEDILVVGHTARQLTITVLCPCREYVLYFFIESIAFACMCGPPGRVVVVDPVHCICLCLHNIVLILNSTTRTIACTVQQCSVKFAKKAPLAKTIDFATGPHNTHNKYYWS